MTNGEKFKEVFGFGADGSRVIAVNATWWDCEFQNSKPMYDELVKRLRDAATMSEALAVLLPHSEGNATAKLYKEAADAIEDLIMRLHDGVAAIAGMQCEIERMVVLGGKPRWIPVTKRLPEPYKNVLLYSGEEFYTGYMHSGKRFTVNASHFPDRPTHWMPLPEPPKEES